MSSHLLKVVALAALTASCGPSQPSPTPRDLVLSGSAQIVGVGGTTLWTVKLRLTDFSESDVPGKVEWVSSDPKVASVSSTGTITALAFGSASISASYQSASARKTVQVVPLIPVGFVVTPTLAFTDVGQTAQLSVAVLYTDNSKVDVTAETQWISSDQSVVAVTPSGAVTAASIGSVTLTGTYGGQVFKAVASVTPPATFTVSGRVRLPGAGQAEGLGVPGFTVTNLSFGNTTVSDAKGQYSIAAATNGTTLRFEKTGFETAELVVNGPNGSPTVQRLIRINAGESATSDIFENDINYAPSPTFSCLNCRLIRVVSPSAGTLHIQVDWSFAGIPALWVNGLGFAPALDNPRQLLADIAVDAGETLLYVRSGSGFVTVTVKTSFSAPLGPGH